MANGNGKCFDHRAVDIRLTHLEEAQKQIKNMFWAIVAGLFFALVGIYGDLYAKYTGPAVAASEIEQTLKET